MQKTRNSDCLYIKSLDILRPFLTLISYGCYSRMQIKNRLPYASAYDRRLELLNFCLSPTSWKCAAEKKKHRFFFLQSCLSDRIQLYVSAFFHEKH